MTDLKEVLTSRSRYQDTLRCARARYWLHEWRGTGLESVKVALPLATGTSVHAGLAALLRQTLSGEALNIDAAVAVALADYDEKCAGRGLDLDALESQSFSYAEQRALTEALVRVAGLRVVPRLLEMYEVLEVETLDRRTLDQDPDGTRRIVWRSIADGLLRSRDDGELYLLSWKTCAELPKDSDARVDIQGVSEAWTLAGRLEEYREMTLAGKDGVPGWFWPEYPRGAPQTEIRGVQMVYLVKGQRRDAGKEASSDILGADAVAAGARVKKTASPLIYGYQDKSFPPKLAWATTWQCSAPHAMRKSSWYPTGECPGDGRNHKRSDDWTSFPVWETLSVKEWIRMLDEGEVTPEAGDALDAQWSIQVPMFRTQGQIDRWFRQARSVERRIASDLTLIREYEDALSEAPEDTELLDLLLARLDETVLGPQDTNQCERWFGRRCACIELCHGDGRVAADPLGSGLYQIKTQYVERASGDEA